MTGEQRSDALSTRRGGLGSEASSPLEIFLAPNKPKVGLGVHVALDMQLTAQRLWPTEEYTRLGWRVDFLDAPEYHVPIRRRIGGCAEAGDSIMVRAGVVDHDVCGIVIFDFGGQVLRGLTRGSGISKEGIEVDEEEMDLV